jgi:hypothetical protein
MSETQRRANNTTRILSYLQQHGRAMNHELIPIGGMRAEILSLAADAGRPE